MWSSSVTTGAELSIAGISAKELAKEFNQIIEQNKGILFKVARGYCLNVEDQQDLIQEMMIQIWHVIHKYDDRYKLSTFL